MLPGRCEHAKHAGWEIDNLNEYNMNIPSNSHFYHECIPPYAMKNKPQWKHIVITYLSFDSANESFGHEVNFASSTDSALDFIDSRQLGIQAYT